MNRIAVIEAASIHTRPLYCPFPDLITTDEEVGNWRPPRKWNDEDEAGAGPNEDCQLSGTDSHSCSGFCIHFPVWKPLPKRRIEMV